MKNVFLSYQFGDQDRDLVDLVDRLLRSHGLEVFRGRRTAGQPVDQTVRNRIESCDALVALLTQDPDAQDPRPSAWVRDELLHAQNTDIPSIGLLESGVQIAGMNAQNREYPELDRANPADALVALSETLGEWKKVRVKLQLVPEAIANRLGGDIDQAKVEYRTSIEGDYSSWVEGRISNEGYGTFAYVEPRTDDHLIQLKVTHDGDEWNVPAIQQWVRVSLDAD